MFLTKYWQFNFKKYVNFEVAIT